MRMNNTRLAQGGVRVTRGGTQTLLLPCNVCCGFRTGLSNAENAGIPMFLQRPECRCSGSSLQNTENTGRNAGDAVTLQCLSFIQSQRCIDLKSIARWGHPWLLCVGFEFEHGGVRAGAVERGHPVESVDDVEKLVDVGGEFPRFPRVLPWGGLRRVHRCHAVEERAASPLCVHVPRVLRLVHPPAFGVLHGASLVAEAGFCTGPWKRRGRAEVDRECDAAPPLRCDASEVARAGRAGCSIAGAGGGHVRAGWCAWLHLTLGRNVVHATSPPVRHPAVVGDLPFIVCGNAPGMPAFQQTLKCRHFSSRCPAFSVFDVPVQFSVRCAAHALVFSSSPTTCFAMDSHKIEFDLNT